MPTAKYVKFQRGTPTAYAALTNKDSDTLYFISNPNEKFGTLYLGEKTIGDGQGIDGARNLAELGDVDLTGAVAGSILTYNGVDKWVVQSIDELKHATAIYKVIPEDNETNAEAITRILSDTAVFAGDIVIVKKLIANNKYQYTSYVYDEATTAWIAMDGNYDAENVYFSKDIIYTTNVGVLTVEDNGRGTIAAIGKNVKQVLDSILAKEEDPKVVQPSVILASSQMTSYEVGTKVSPSYTTSLNPGSYSFGPATGIVAKTYSVSFNGETLTTATGTFKEMQVTDVTNLSIISTITYDDGAIPVTNLGNNSNSDQILAGSKTATKGTLKGYRNSFYGTFNDKTKVLNSANIRALTGKSGKDYAKGSVFTITLPVGAQSVIFAYPADLPVVSSVKDINGMNAEIKSAFNESTVAVTGANDYTAIDYRVYRMDMAEPLAKANSYKVTI